METIDTIMQLTPIEGADEIILEEGQTALLETETGTYVFVPLEGKSDVIAHLLSQINCKFITAQKPEAFDKTFNNHKVFLISNDTIEVEQEIHQLQQLLDNTRAAPRETKPREMEAPKEKVHSSLFSLAKSVFKSQSRPVTTQPNQQAAHTKGRVEGLPAHVNTAATTPTKPRLSSKEGIKGIYRVERDDQKQSGNGGSGNQQQNQQKEAAQKTEREAADEALLDVNQIFHRFMDLMARILGQAEAEAHELYQKIKHRTDQVDLLTSLIQKINNEAEEIDWSNNPEMLQLVQQAREIGVEIPADKTKWSVEEKRLLKENISMRKDSMEKVTQLERTDMQRYLQEASQCHQARSNILKLLKEVIDTIIYNLRS